MRYPTHLLKLVTALRRLPGVGTKTAERFAFQMISWHESELRDFASVIHTLPEQLSQCRQCGCLMDEKCLFCTSESRSGDIICIVASPRDVYAIEETSLYRGHYHVLDALLSPLEGRGPEGLQLAKLQARLAHLQTKEVILALDSTVEGDATSLYLKQMLAPMSVEVSRLAFGLPMGSPLEYADSGTLARALSGRRTS